MQYRTEQAALPEITTQDSTQAFDICIIGEILQQGEDSLPGEMRTRLRHMDSLYM